MDVFSPFSDPIPYGSGCWAAADLPESSEGRSGRPANFSDEEVILASSRPKKRAGRKKFRETRHPVYRGVRRRNSGKWVCEVREPNKKSRIWLGTFPTEEMAARAHDVAAIALRGRLACLNFADSAWRLPVPASADPKDIRKTAAEAAEAFRPTKPDSGKQEDSKMAMPAEAVFFMDEEAVFEWPGLLEEMAKGLMMPPPEFSGAHGFSGEEGEAEAEAEAELPLWSFSM